MSELNKLFGRFEPQKLFTTEFKDSTKGNGYLSYVNVKEEFGETINVKLPTQNNGFFVTKKDSRTVFAYRIDLTTEIGKNLYDHLKVIDKWIEETAFKESLSKTKDKKIVDKIKGYNYVSIVSNFESEEENKDSKTLWIKFNEKTNFIVQEKNEAKKISLTNELLEKDKLRGNYTIKIGINGMFANNISKAITVQVFMKSVFLEKGNDEHDEFLENIMKVKNLKLKEEESTDTLKKVEYEEEEELDSEDQHKVEND